MKISLSISKSDLIKRLEEDLLSASKTYYNTGSYAKIRGRTVTDSIFDTWQEKLRELKPTSKVLKQIGAPTKTRGKVRLPYPMFSLDKIKPENADAWLASHKGPYVISDKEDGVSGQVVFDRTNAKLYTRGNGTFGQDISHLVPYLKIPKIKRDIAVRGEFTMSEGTFNSKYSKKFENARNMTSGLINSKEVNPAVKDLDFIAYSILSPRLKPSEQLGLLKRLGFKTVNYKLVDKLSGTQLSKILTRRKTSHTRGIDGLVVEQDIKTSLPTSNPSNAVAFKELQSDNLAETTVTKIVWTESKTGKLIPVVHFKPVRLAGVTVKQASGHNAWFILNGTKSKNVPKPKPIGPNAIVKITRSNEVIPYILDVVKAAKPQMPSVPYVIEGVNARISKTTELGENKNLHHFFKTLGIENLALKTISKLAANGLDSVPKIIKAVPADFQKIEGIQRTSAVKLYTNIQSKLSNVPLHVLMDASGVFGEGLGSKKLLPLVTMYPSVITDYKVFLGNSGIQKILKVPGFSDKSIEKFQQGLPKFIAFLNRTKLKYVIPTKVKASSSKLKNMSVIFTGVRDKSLEDLIVKNGGEVVTTPSKATILIAKDINGSSSKLVAARSKGIPIMTIDSFRRKYSI